MRQAFSDVMHLNIKGGGIMYQVDDRPYFAWCMSSVCDVQFGIVLVPL
jgi:hypothetical protein